LLAAEQNPRFRVLRFAGRQDWFRAAVNFRLSVYLKNLTTNFSRALIISSGSASQGASSIAPTTIDKKTV
jgi:hypothetical protein